MIRNEQQNTERLGTESVQASVEVMQDKKSVDEIVDGSTLVDDELMSHDFY